MTVENFFVPKKIWRNGGPFPHTLILLSEYPEFREYARAHAELLAEYGDQLGVIPRVAALHRPGHPPRDRRRPDRQAARCPARGAGRHGPVPGPARTGVARHHRRNGRRLPENGMAELNGRVRRAMEKVPGITLRPLSCDFGPTQR
ncbi:hypothetical protein NKH18_48825 [Streptomyces sp. M10(2022)]